MKNVHLKQDPITSTIYFNEKSNWDDLRFPATQINIQGVVDDPDVDSEDGTFLFANNVTDIIKLIAQLPHGILRDSKVYPHIHWQATTSSIGDVFWRLEYQIASIAGSFPGSWTALDILGHTTNNANRHLFSGFDPIDLSGYDLSSIIKFRLSRHGTEATDTYNSDAKLLEFDVHYQKDSVGSGQQDRK